MEKKALILMASYNGEKYIAEQLESIINQTWEEWKLVIRDDGSSDNTISILDKYAKYDNRIIYCVNDTNRHGAYSNFWTLIHEARMSFADYDYYFFSDQDDVWEKNKIEVMIEEAEKSGMVDKSLLLYADMSIINSKDQVIHKSLNDVMGIGEMKGYSLLFTHGFLWGCDICVNKELFLAMPLLPLDHQHIDIMSHDNYIGKYALVEGKIKYIDKVLINHRRHEDNTTGGYSLQLSPLKILKSGIIRFGDLSKTHARVYNQTLIFFDMLNRQSAKNYESIDNIRKAILKGGISLVNCMGKCNVERKQKARTCGIYLVGLIGSYKKYLFYR